MHFRFVLWNHNADGQRSLEDVIGIIGHQLRALGHGADWIPGSQDFAGPRAGAVDVVNVVVEGFTSYAVEDLRRAREAGARIICLATEEPTPQGFNFGKIEEMVTRQEMFPAAAKFFDGILHLTGGETATKWYGQWAPSAPAELGYAPTLVYPDDNQAPRWETGFYGSISPRRAKLLKRLAKVIGGPGSVVSQTREGLAAAGKLAVRLVGDFAAQAERDAAMRDCKVIVQLKKFDGRQPNSTSRCCKSVLLRRPLLSEPFEGTEPFDQIVRFAPSLDDFFREIPVTRAVWRQIAAAQLDKLKARLTPDLCIGDPLRKIGILTT